MTKPAFDETDRIHLEHCLKLAEMARGRTSPNPMVGSVIVDKEGALAGVGFHRGLGQAHAEVAALENAGDRARGATLYVNLEPCCHFGRTPPCVDRIIESGIKRVVAGMLDPNPQVNGAGIERLKASGIDVSVGVLEDQCRILNRGFIKHVSQGLPWVCLKLAGTLDGRIADCSGSSRWVSGATARGHVHQLRNTLDCVLIGGRTAFIDDPELTVRDIEDGRNPSRAVVDPQLTLDPRSRLCQSAESAPTFVFALQEAIAKRGSALPAAVKLIAVECTPDDATKLNLRRVLFSLADAGVCTVLCEGGGRLAGSLLKEGLVDEVHWIVSPKIIGDQNAIPAVSGLGPISLNQAIPLANVTVRELAGDVLICGFINQASTPER